MRPLKLTMIAFGPYRERETVDFTRLEERRLFVISGNTGAGKTTIFDAICFALYGSASGEDRYDARMLRSHFAEEETHTAVELDFAVGTRTYRVFRQLPHRKKGNKSETGDKIELYETTDGTAEPCVDRFMISEVNARLQRIIGLTKDQFNQIVMLPQGEFRKLLTSETENKEEILRRLFRTELYPKLEAKFHQRGRELRELLQKSQTELDFHQKRILEVLPEREESALHAVLAQPHHSVQQVIEGLELERAYYERVLGEAQAERQRLAEAAEAEEAGYRAAERLNARFAELAQKRSEQAALEARLPQAEAERERLRQAERAAQLAPYAEQLARAAAQAAAARERLDAQQREAAAAAQGAEQAEQRWQGEAAREDERRAAERELARLAELAPTVAQLAVRREALAQLVRAEQAGAKRLAELERELAETRAARQALGEEARELERAVAALPERQRELDRMRGELRLVLGLLELEKQMADFARLEGERQRTRQQASAEYERLESLWIEGQASLLAEHLHDGKPCPVCGSTEHPVKAGGGAALPSKEELQAAKERLRVQEQELGLARSQLAAARSGWADKQAELGSEYGGGWGGGAQLLTGIGEAADGAGDTELGGAATLADGPHAPADAAGGLSDGKVIDIRAAAAGRQGHGSAGNPPAAGLPGAVALQERHEQLLREGKRLKAETVQLEERRARLEQLRPELERVELRLSPLEREKEAAAAAHQQRLVQRHAEQSALEADLARVPEELREPGRLEAQQRAVQAQAERLAAAWAAAQEARQLAATRLATATAALEQLQREAGEAAAQHGEADARFARELAQAGFASPDAYRAAQLDEPARQALRAACDRFDAARAALAQHVAALARELDGAEPADLAALAERLAAARRALEAAGAALQHAGGHVREAGRLRDALAEAQARHRAAEAQLERVLDVYQTLKGDNALKMSFERYILIEYLEQIVQAANERLRRLSNGQFTLQRSDRLESKGRQSGLGLDVYDAYTGQTRDVKTMSGGEKFNASLCLALGMTDVIQSHQGGVTIEMMFIDEGFGTLDEDALGKAIDTLVDLQRAGRMIGVISHVPELKAAFPAVLEVRKTKEGHSRTALLVK